MEEADSIFRNEHDLLHRIRLTGSAGHMPIRLIYANEFFTPYINSFMLEYNRRYEVQKFYLERTNWASLSETLSRGETDLAFCLDESLMNVKNIEMRTLYKAANSIVMSRRNPLASLSSITFDQLKNETIMFSSNIIEKAYREMAALGLKYDFKPHIVWEHSSLETVLMEVALGNGVSPVIHGLLPDKFNQELVSIPCYELEPLRIVIAWNKAIQDDHLLAVVNAISQYQWFN